MLVALRVRGLGHKSPTSGWQHSSPGVLPPCSTFIKSHEGVPGTICSPAPAKHTPLQPLMRAVPPTSSPHSDTRRAGSRRPVAPWGKEEMRSLGKQGPTAQRNMQKAYFERVKGQVLRRAGLCRRSQGHTTHPTPGPGAAPPSPRHTDLPARLLLLLTSPPRLSSTLMSCRVLPLLKGYVFNFYLHPSTVGELTP